MTLHKGFGDTALGRGTATLRLPGRRHKCLGKPFRKTLRDEDPVSHPQGGAYLPIPSSWEDFKVYDHRDEALQNSQSIFGGRLLSLLQLSLPWKMPQGMQHKALGGSCNRNSLFLENRMVLWLYLMTSWKHIAINSLIHVSRSFLQTSSLLSASFVLSTILHFQMTSSGTSLLKSQRSSKTKGRFALHLSFLKAQIEKDRRREGFLALLTGGFITGW